MIDPADPRITERMRAIYAEASAAGYEDRIFVALRIAVMALVQLEDEAIRCRHPDGRGSGGSAV